MKIEELEFSARVYNCLRREGIDTVEQLERMSDKDLMSLRNFGVACLAEVRQKVACWREIEKPAMTNGDRVRRMTNEELAKILGDKNTCPDDGECTHRDCQMCWLEWLQQPAEVQGK